MRVKHKPEGESTVIRLPEHFVQSMHNILGRETDAFLASYNESRSHGLRFNPLKTSPDSPQAAELRERFQLELVPWCAEGFYFNEETRPGRHPYHAAGLYYIQEPSAMSSAELLAPEPGDIVLDLAAAPGGKSTQIAGMMRGQGLLIANEIHPARAKILSENIERMGVSNAVVVSMSPDALSARFPVFFDKIMLDAPCSGEGMFRKDADAIAEWSPEHVTMCAARQRDILREAVRMLKPGGTMAYSTCTFNREENEANIDWLLTEFGEFELLRIERIWPHKTRGEGHFVALLRKNGETAAAAAVCGKAGSRRGGKGGGGTAGKGPAEAMRLFEAFAGETLPGLALPPGEALLFGDQLYWLPAMPGTAFGAAQLEGVRTLRPGLHLGELKPNRFEPAHALALAAGALIGASEPAGLPAAWPVLSLGADSPEAGAYLRGETLPAPSDAAGWTLVAVDGWPLGWGKASGGQLKNHYPKGLRRFN